MKPVRMWVDKNFKKQLKREAADSGQSILELTKEMAKRENEERERKKRFNFNF